MKSGLIVSKIIFRGPNVAPVEVGLRQGLNVIEGAAETGKSFLLEAIDFMLGGGSALRDIPERIPYDTLLLQGAFSGNGVAFTVQRSTQCGRYLWREGHHDVLDAEKDERLGETHNPDRDDNLSNWLLKLLGLVGHHLRVKTNEVKALCLNNTPSQRCGFELVSETVFEDG